MFQQTLLRNKEADEFIVVTNEQQFFLVLDQAGEVGVTNLSFILEPVGRNTAPAIALACLSVDPNETVLITPSDHLIKHVPVYSRLVKEADNLAKEKNLVTFGLVPTFPATGFGYIEAKGNDVLSFKEKPNEETAKAYIAQGNYYWNSGMFIFEAGEYLKELNQYAPEILSKSKEAYQKALVDKNYALRRIQHQDMMDIPANSIDYAVMEQSKRVKVLCDEFGWSDLGSYDELYNELPKDADNNAISGPFLGIDSKNNLVITQEGKLVTTLGVEDMIIVETGDALLVSKKGRSQQVKEVVQELSRKKSDLADTHLTVHRPWGNYTTLLEVSSRYKIKRIIVKPNHKLSLQKHFHRNEHWVVVSGTAKIQIGEETLLLRENESTYIPMGQVHRLENPGKMELVMIEAQVGHYLQEDDIVRLEDEFNRS